MVPSHSLDYRPESAVDLCCFIQETVLTQIFEAVVVSLSLHAALMIPCPVGLVKIRLPSCQLGDVNGASSRRISQPVASKMTRGGSEMPTQGMGLIPRGCWSQAANWSAGFLQCLCALESLAAGLHGN